MGFLADLLIRIGADGSEVRKELRSIRTDLAGWSSDLTSIGQKLTGVITLPIVGMGIAALKTAGQLEQNAIAFKTMMGSADLAGQHLSDLKAFALSTPFQFPDLVLASKRMQALGFDAKSVIPALTNIGDAAAALGMGAEGIQRITTALGQMKAKGVVQAEEMRQLAEAGIPAWQILAKTLNTDVAGAMKMVENRTVEAATAVPALLAGMNEKFGGLMKQQSETLLGQFSNLKDAISFTLADIGKTLEPLAKNIMQGVVQPALDGLKDLAARFAAMPPVMQETIIAFVGIAAAVGPVLWAFGGIASGLKDIAGLALRLPQLLNPVTLVIVAVAAAAVVLYNEAQKTTIGLHGLDKAFNEFLIRNIDPSIELRKRIEELSHALSAGKISIGEYNTRLGELEAAEKKALLNQDFKKSRELLDKSLDMGVISMSQYIDQLKILNDREQKAVQTGAADTVIAFSKALGLTLHIVTDSAVANDQWVKSILDAEDALGVHIPDVKALGAALTTVYGAYRQGAVGVGVWTAAIAAYGAQIAAFQKTIELMPELPDLPKMVGTLVGSVPMRVDWSQWLNNLPTAKDTSSILNDSGLLTLNQSLNNLATDSGDVLKRIREQFGLTDDVLKQFAKNINLSDAFGYFRIQSTEELKKLAEDSETWYNVMLSDERTSDAQRLEAFRQMMMAKLELQRDSKSITDEEYADTKKQLEQLGQTSAQVGIRVKSVAQQMVDSVHGMFRDLSRGIAQNIVEFKGWADTLKSIFKNLAVDALSIMISGLIAPLEKKLVGLIGNAGGTAASAGGAAASAGSGVAGAAASGATGLMGAISVVSGAITAVSSVIGNFQMAGMNKSLDLLVNHTLRIFNELSYFRQDAWTRETHLMLKLDDIWGAIRNVGSVGSGGGSSAKGGPTFINCVFNGTNQGAVQVALEYASLAGAVNP